MSTPARNPYPDEHPVALDLELRERVLDVMWFKIQKTISSTVPAKRRSASTADLQLAGGIRAEEVLNAALDGVLRKDPKGLVGTWEAYATGVAHNKAVQAVRDSVKGRARAGKEVDLRSINREDAEGRTIGDNLTDEPGARHVYVQCAKKVLAAARQDPEFERFSNPDRGGD